MTRKYKNKSIDECLLLVMLNRNVGYELMALEQAEDGRFNVAFVK